VNDPELLVLDEPTVAMDVESRRSFWVAMREFATRGRTVLFATHYLDEADQNADRIVLMAHGKVVVDGPPTEIKARVGTRTIRVTLPGVAEAELAALAERGGAWITAVAHGRAAHGSQPDRGVNAIVTMSRFLLRLHEALPDREHELVGRPTVNVALVSGGSAPNVVPDRCEVDIDRRIIPGEDDPDEVIAPFRRLVEDLKSQHPESDIEPWIREWTEAAEADGSSVIAAVARDAVGTETGTPAPFVGFTGITDARYYINDAKIPTVILGPGSLSIAHTADEWVGVDELVTAARTYARIFVAFLGATRVAR